MEKRDRQAARGRVREAEIIARRWIITAAEHRAEYSGAGEIVTADDAIAICGDTLETCSDLIRALDALDRVDAVLDEWSKPAAVPDERVDDLMKVFVGRLRSAIEGGRR